MSWFRCGWRYKRRRITAHILCASVCRGKREGRNHLFIVQVLSNNLQAILEVIEGLLWLLLLIAVNGILLFLFLFFRWWWWSNWLVSMSAGVRSSVCDLKNGGIFIWSLHLLCSQAVLSISVGAPVIASAYVTISYQMSNLFIARWNDCWKT